MLPTKLTNAEKIVTWTNRCPQETARFLKTSAVKVHDDTHMYHYIQQEHGKLCPPTVLHIQLIERVTN